jgi:acetate kinase
LSETGCGEIDSAIVFQLLADGVSKGQVEKLLSKQSGFKALAGGLFKLKDVLRRRDAKAKFTREVFCYQILKNIGSYITSLSGLDLILFIGEDQMEIKNLVSELLLSLRFIGVQRKENVFRGEVSLLTESNSLVKAYFLKKKSNKRFL